MRTAFRLFFPVVLAVVVCFGGCGRSPDQKTTLVVGSAISLQPFLDDVIGGFLKANPNDSVVISYAGSGTIRHQIRFGAPIDVFLSAATEHIDSLQKAGFLIAGSRLSFASNDLVLIMPVRRAPIGGLAELELSGISRIAIGEPEIVPAGRYAHQTLLRSGLMESVAKKLVFTKDVQQVLVYVQSGSVDAGFVYSSDLRSAPPVRTIQVIPDSLHDPIRYEGAVLQSSEYVEAASRLLSYLASDTAKTALLRHGYRESAR